MGSEQWIIASAMVASVMAFCRGWFGPYTCIMDGGNVLNSPYSSGTCDLHGDSKGQKYVNFKHLQIQQ